MEKYFYDTNDPYKMSLRVETNPNKDDKCLNIYLLIWHDQKSDGLKWPFARNVYIELRNQNTAILQYQHVVIRKPSMTSCKSSNAFIFQYSTLQDYNYKLPIKIDVKCFF